MESWLGFLTRCGASTLAVRTPVRPGSTGPQWQDERPGHQRSLPFSGCSASPAFAASPTISITAAEPSRSVRPRSNELMVVEDDGPEDALVVYLDSGIDHRS